MAAGWDGIKADVDVIADEWRSARGARQQRRHLDAADFDRIAATGFFPAVVPEEAGGLWLDVSRSTRPVCDVLRAFAGADPSVALVSSMHPAVLAFWLAQPADATPAWRAQRAAVAASAANGAQWGTITSEPGSGGDIARTRATAAAAPDLDAPLPGDTYRVTGDKHFGSGSGVTDYMITTAVAEGEEAPSVFVLDVRDRPWDGSAGVRLIAEWDGMGMAATQSHAMRLDGCPAVRMAWPGPIEEITMAAGPFIASAFTSVLLGVLDEAIATARTQLEPKRADLRPYEQVEWTRAELDHWLAVQAYDGALRAVESGDHLAGLHAALRAKEAVAELAEASLSRLCRVIGGGTFSRRSPFSAWYEDVRALGFLRPPWGLAFDSLYGMSFR